MMIKLIKVHDSTGIVLININDISSIYASRSGNNRTIIQMKGSQDLYHTVDETIDMVEQLIYKQDYNIDKIGKQFRDALNNTLRVHNE